VWLVSNVAEDLKIDGTTAPDGCRNAGSYDREKRSPDGHCALRAVLPFCS
jgi:hypothetical protein